MERRNVTTNTPSKRAFLLHLFEGDWSVLIGPETLSDIEHNALPFWKEIYPSKDLMVVEEAQLNVSDTD